MLSLSDLRQPKTEKRHQIVEAAARVFARKGFAGAVVADIAVEARIGKGTVYEYFDSKEDLFFAVFEWFQNKTEAAAMVRISSLGGSAADRLRALSETLMGLWDPIKDVFALTMEFWAASSSAVMRDRFRAAFKRLYDDYRGLVASLIREGINAGNFPPDIHPEAIAAALVGTWDALFLQAWFDDAFDPAATAREFLETVLRGLKAAEPQK
jgi:AcrR family transcriptional regulator